MRAFDSAPGAVRPSIGVISDMSSSFIPTTDATGLSSTKRTIERVSFRKSRRGRFPWHRFLLSVMHSTGIPNRQRQPSAGGQLADAVDVAVSTSILTYRKLLPRPPLLPLLR